MSNKYSEAKRAYQKKWFKGNPNYAKNYRQKHLKRKLEIERNYREKHREELRIRSRESSKRYYHKHKLTYRKSPKHRLDHNIRWLIADGLKRQKGGLGWEKLVGYTLKDLVEHLEKQFDDKMTWENYGSYWWIDHIKPRSLFQYEIAEDVEFKKCWALTNLQPLERIANIAKGAKYPSH